MSARRRKFQVDDFELGGLLGEGAYARVVVGTLKEDGEAFAVKMVDKQHVMRAGKSHEVINEKRVLSMLAHPGVIKLHSTFQDEFSLYYVLELAMRGELFSLIRLLGTLPLPVARFFAAEIVLVLEYMHGRGVVHRDLKPENILISAEGHVKITDFATSKVLTDEERAREAEGVAVAAPAAAAAPVPEGAGKEEDNGDDQEKGEGEGEEEDEKEARPARAPSARRQSFVGTAHYVSPELLNGEGLSTSADLWALGVVIYQMLTGSTPFWVGSEFATFQKILEGRFEFPDGFHEDARDLVSRLLVQDPAARLGFGPGGYEALKAHPFFAGVDWDGIFAGESPSVELAELADLSGGAAERGSMAYDSDEELLSGRAPARPDDAEVEEARRGGGDDAVWRSFLLQGELVLFRGMVQKKRGIFAKRRMLLLTSFPRLVYVDTDAMTVRGEIRWADSLWAEVKSERVFHIHTPGRYYHMVSLDDDVLAADWVREITKLKREVKERASQASEVVQAAAAAAAAEK